jgi:hypothetical protein
MNSKLEMLGRVLGLIGTIACVAAIVLRLMGLFLIGGVSLGAIIQGGIALVVIGCFAILSQTTRSN